jgi:ribulose 1,5-bisphosphate synthetase/thiazole synthase
MHPMLIPSRRNSRYKNNDENIYDVIIIGAGISGLLAADILLRE